MSLFSWFSRKAPAPPPSEAVVSSLSKQDATRPLSTRLGAEPPRSPSAQPAASAQAGAAGSGGEKKNARYMRRELLYGIVRESMVRAGVLSASYKFKALALDPRGLQFLVMVDIAKEFGGNSERFIEIELMIAQSAKIRHGIMVTAVYWRLNESVQVGGSVKPIAATASAPAGAAAAVAAVAAVQPAAKPAAAAAPAVASMPMPLFPGSDSGPAHLEPAVADHLPNFDPVADDEVDAFKRALAAGAGTPPQVAPLQHPQMRPVPTPAAPAVQLPQTKAQPMAQPIKAAAAAAAQPQSYTLLTGYEDTEMIDPDFAPPALGNTQYGELR